MIKIWRITITALAACLAVTTLSVADDISLTVYNSDLGVVREVRNLSFVEGDGRIAFTDVAARIDATS
ncbi:MAG: hypothetical protein GY841_19480, partial [FCB group bacterium]|nr:hypothetical protein [FCB group bacterium]